MREKKDRIKGYLAQAYLCARKWFDKNDKELDMESALFFIITFLDRFIEANDEYEDIEAHYYTRWEPEGFCPDTFNPKLFTNEWRIKTKNKNLNDENGIV